MIWLTAITGVALAPFALLALFFGALGLMELATRGFGVVAEQGLQGRGQSIWRSLLAAPKFLVLMFMNIRRNLLRSSLSYLVIFVMVLVIVCIWSILGFLESQMAARAANFRALVTDKFQIPSQMPPRYVAELTREVQKLPEAVRPDPIRDVLTWSFVGTSLDPDPAKRSLENIIFFFAMKPRGLLTMMDDLEQDRLPPDEAKQMRDNVDAMQKNLKGIILSEEKLRTIGRKIGDRLTVYCFPALYKDIQFDVEIIGTFPKSAGRYDGNAILNLEYLEKALDTYEKNKRRPHPMADRYINLYWVRVKDEATMLALSELLDQPGKFATPPVKIERGSSAIASFLEPYRGILLAMRFLLVPAIIAVMVLVIANAISISVRERRSEMAVLKVLGFQPWQVLILIVGEAVLLGAVSGGICTSLAYFGVNAIGGIRFPIAFFSKFFVPAGALWWGPALGVMAAVAGSFIPAWSARRVRVSEVFAKIA